jgi:hypothetical protein
MLWSKAEVEGAMRGVIFEKYDEKNEKQEGKNASRVS